MPAAATSSDSLDGMRLEEASATREPSDSLPLLSSSVPAPVFANHNQNEVHV
jgi:serine/threonine protein kinase HipA of HipAB toxin-antitoxin module